MPSDPFAQSERPDHYHKRRERRSAADAGAGGVGQDGGGRADTSGNVVPFFDAIARTARFSHLEDGGCGGGRGGANPAGATSQMTPEQITRYHLDGRLVVRVRFVSNSKLLYCNIL